MKKKVEWIHFLAAAAFVFVLAGCSGAFWSGAGGGTVATGAGYELRARQQMQKIDEQRKRGEIDDREYNIRKDQIQQGSLAY